jgi:sugar phosphate isomerase/epimerase
MNTRTSAPEFVLSHFSLGRYHPFEQRVVAAAAAGFDGIGLYIGDYQRLTAEGCAGGSLDELLDAHRMRVREIEVVSAWARPGTDDRGFEATAWEMTDRWGCRYLQAIGSFDGTIGDTAAAFAGLCDRAADHGLVVGLEFLPFTNIPDARVALEIVERADRDNGGVCVDIWHHRRGLNDLDAILAIPASRITGVQLNDGTLAQELDDYKDDCLRRRVPPGLGQFAVAEFVRALLDHGVTVPWSAEVCADTVWAADDDLVRAHVQECGDGLRRVWSAATNDRPRLPAPNPRN